MAKKKRPGRGDRDGGAHRRHLRPRDAGRAGPSDGTSAGHRVHPGHHAHPAGAIEDQELFRALRQALRDDEPFVLLNLVSALMAVTDPRSRSPFERDDPATTLPELVESFIGVSFAESTAALTVIAALTPDELLAARIRRTLASRRHPLPGWLSGLDAAAPEPDVWLLTHILGDGDDYLFGVTLPGGRRLSMIVYVDHNLGTVVKDAFAVPEPLADLVQHMASLIDDPDQTLIRADAADARARVEAAIEFGAMFYPPLESESWPGCRPLLEWLLRMQPSGGVAPERREWTDDERAAVVEEFFASPFGAPLDGADERDLIDTLLWFGTSYANGDPFTWSIVTVELLLLDWFPRKVVAEPEYLAQLPAVLRAFIGYSHDRLALRPELTDAALVMVDELEPEYQRTIRSERLQGPSALLAEMLEGELGGDAGFGGFGGFGDAGLALGDGDGDPWLGVGDDPNRSEAEIAAIVLRLLEGEVGGRPQLQSLDTRPLPDEPFEWAGLPDDVRPQVQTVLDSCDRCADELLDVEHRTAMRRFLSRAVAGDPALFRRKASPSRLAAAVAWVICSANKTIGPYRSMEVRKLLAWFGVTGGVSDRAKPMLRAVGVHECPPSALQLGTPDLLTAERRTYLVNLRDHWTR